MPTPTVRQRAILLVTFLSLNALAWGADGEKAKDSYFNKAENQLKEWSAKADRLEQQTQKTGTKTRSELDSQLRQVQAKLNVARRRLTRLEKSSEGAWGSLRQGTDKALKDVQQAYQQALSNFNKK